MLAPSAPGAAERTKRGADGFYHMKGHGMNERHDGVPTIAELMAEEDSRTGRRLVQLVAGLLIAIGLLFTGFLNFMLYSKPFPESYKIFGVIPAILIEGSL